MKRFTCYLLVFATLAFTAVGCRRSGDTKQPPVNITMASDFIPPPRLVNSAAFLKRDKNAPRIVVTPNTRQQLTAVGKVYVDFLTSGKAPKLNTEDIKLGLLRAGFDEARNAVEEKTVVIVFEADETYPDHIVAYLQDITDGKREVVFVNQKISKLDDNALKQRLPKQALQAVYARYKAYSGQAAQKSLGDFKAYLKSNAQPALATAVDTQSIKVNVAAQVNNAGHLVACFASMDPNLALGKSVYGIMGNGEVRTVEPEFVQQVFPR